MKGSNRPQHLFLSFLLPSPCVAAAPHFSPETETRPAPLFLCDQSDSPGVRSAEQRGRGHAVCCFCHCCCRRGGGGKAPALCPVPKPLSLERTRLAQPPSLVDPPPHLQSNIPCDPLVSSLRPRRTLPCPQVSTTSSRPSKHGEALAQVLRARISVSRATTTLAFCGERRPCDFAQAPFSSGLAAKCSSETITAVMAFM